METAQATEKEVASNFLSKIDLEISKHNDMLEVLISNTKYSKKQIASFQKFSSDEELILRSKIKMFSEHYDKQLAVHELKIVSEDSPLYPTYLRLQRELINDMETLIFSEIALFQKKIAQFILLLEV